MRGLNEALESLLYRTSEREAFLAGDRARFQLSSDDEDALATIDHEQLISAAKQARTHVIERKHRGVGSLREVFRETLSAWKGDEDDLAIAFVESAPFEQHRTHAHSGRGISLEEAFYRFAEERALGTAAVRLREVALGVLCGLALIPNPTFALPDFVRRAPKGHYVVLPEGPTLMAILNGKLIRGPITPFIAAMLQGEPVPENDERRTVEAELAKLGLL